MLLVAADAQDLVSALQQDHAGLLLLADHAVPATACLLDRRLLRPVGCRWWLPLVALLRCPPCISISHSRRAG
jgi:hypothetical protein